MNGYFIFLTSYTKLRFLVYSSVALFWLVVRSLASPSARAWVLKLLLFGRLKFASEPCLWPGLGSSVSEWGELFLRVTRGTTGGEQCAGR